MISKARLKFLRSLRLKKVRAEEGLVLVEGLNVVEEAAARGGVQEFFFSDEVARSARGKALVRRGLPVSRLAPRDVEALKQTRTPAGAFAVVENPCTPFDTRRIGADALVLHACGVADPGNLGTLIRTAAALGAAAVATSGRTVEPTNPKVVRATAGALFRIPVVHAETRDLEAAGFALFVADARGEAVGALKERPPRVALVLGNEPHGIDDAVRDRADRLVAVELQGGVESLNVAVAAGILLHALRALPVASR